MLLVVGIAVVLIIISYGWQVTDIDLSVTQEAQRQVSLGNAMRDLLSPNVFDQDHDIVNTTTTFLIDCSSGTAPVVPTVGTDLAITVDPTCGSSGDPITVRGFNVAPNAVARLNWIGEDGERRVRQIEGSTEDNFVTRSDGSFEAVIEVPRIRGTSGQTHTVELQVAEPVGPVRFSDTTNLVLEKMIETIFVALIATMLSILPSAIVSFLAARNLMHPIRIPLGGLLVTFTLLPIGWLIGAALLGKVGMFALDIGRGTSTGITGAASLLVGFAAVAAAGRTRAPQQTPQTEASAMLRSILTTLIGAVAFIVVIGLIGGLGQLSGRALSGGLPGLIGGFFGSIGQLIELTLPLMSGVIGAVVLSSIGGRLTRSALATLDGAVSHILAGILGGLAGAILLGIASTLGLGAAWLGLLTPIAAAGLGSAVLPQLFNLISPAPPLTAAASARNVHNLISTLLTWVGALLAFLVTFFVMNIGQAVFGSTLPPQETALTLLGVSITSYVLKAMVIGLVLGASSGALVGMHSAFPLGSVTYNITRTALNLLRSIEPLIMGLVFVIWVGIGPFAGVLALALHSIASLGKLYSEQIESIDLGPIEALQSTGANRLQTIMYAVVPQIIPPYIAFTMYRWDINVRMSTIIGFVGGGGIGFLLQQQINLLRYREAGVAVLAIAIVVSVLDYASAAIRERYT